MPVALFPWNKTSSVFFWTDHIGLVKYFDQTCQLAKSLSFG